MKKKITMFGITVALSMSLVQSSLAAEIWSDGDFQLGNSSSGSTNQETTELWSEQANINPSTPTSTDPAPVENQALVFDVSPVIENGRMLVPVRGILEPLGATFDWNVKEGSVTALKGTTVIKLKINSKIAYVNGKEIVLEAPAKITKGRTLVPLRFLSEALGYKVDWDPATTKVTINNQFYFYLKNPSPIKSQNQSSFYVGNWEVWVPGGFATTDSTMNGDGSTTITQEYVNGAKGKKLSIKADGSYSWEVVGGTLNGLWQDTDKGRILLLKGQMDSDWYVEKVDQNQIKIYAWGMTEYGTRIK